MGPSNSAIHTLTSVPSGAGIPPKVREHLFEAFRGSTRAQGSGLGLAIAQEIIRAHGGHIELVTQAEGKGGTLFRITLPNGPDGTS